MKRTGCRWVFALVMTTITTSGSLALAQTPVEGERLGQDTDVVEQFSFDFERTHDRGLHARLGAGASYRLSSIGVGEDTMATTSGLGATASLELSGFVREGLAVGGLVTLEATPEDGLVGLGGALSWYPGVQENWYVGASAGVSTHWAESTALELFEDYGVFAQLELGVGWWVAPESTLGLALVAGAQSFDLDRNGAARTGGHVGLRTTLVFE